MIELKPLFDIEAEVGAPQSLGRSPMGERRCVPILGGIVRGRITGRILSGGADWQVLRSDGFTDVDARYQIEAGLEARIEVWSRGLRHAPAGIMERLNRGEEVAPGAYYFRSAMRFETGAAEFAWLTRVLAVARGIREPERVRLEVFEVA